MLAKGEFRDGNRDIEQWKSVLKIEIISSDESEKEDDEEILVVHPLPWLSDTVSQFKTRLDQEIVNSKTPQAKRQMKRRVIGTSSTRNKPDNLPSWVTKP